VTPFASTHAHRPVHALLHAPDTIVNQISGRHNSSNMSCGISQCSRWTLLSVMHGCAVLLKTVFPATHWTAQRALISAFGCKFFYQQMNITKDQASCLRVQHSCDAWQLLFQLLLGIC